MVLVLHLNHWVEGSTGGLQVPVGLYSLFAKYFGTCLKYEYEYNCQEKSKFNQFFLKQTIISLMHTFILRHIVLNFIAECLVSSALIRFLHFVFGFPIFSAWVPLKRHD
jgi:hypothetical protein